VKKPAVLILQAGSTEPAVAEKLGDYPAWFERILAPLAALTVVRPWEGLPDPSPFDGFVMTGSPRSVTAPEPWMEETARWLLERAKTRPVLGVCFGHQLLAQALGAAVEKNPRGREVGTTEVVLTDAARRDPLFAGAPEHFFAQQTHEDHVPALPPGAVLYASNAQCPVQAFAHGKLIRCVQFHPEMTEETSRLLALARRERLDRTVPGGSAAVLASLRPTPEAARILEKWVETAVAPLARRESNR
jgi:GMP synthase (glutamine-hydrolysing)